MKASAHTFAIEPLQRMLAAGKDSALLRMSLALAHHQRGERDAAIVQLQAALAHDASFTAAWRLLGLLRLEADDTTAAREAFASGLAAARRRGDRQLEKELAVRLRRLAPKEG